MLFTDTYKTIEKPCEASFKDKGSKFLGYAFPVKSEEDVKKYLNELKKQYHDATHHCYAYILGPNSEAQRSNDDGEPSNSAGKPILRAIVSNQLTNTLIVVVRYFGGKLLGVPGLIHAYGETALETIKQAIIIEKIVEELYEITFDYEVENQIFKILKQHEAKIISIDKNEKCCLRFVCRMSHSKFISNVFKEIASVDIQFVQII